MEVQETGAIERGRFVLNRPISFTVRKIEGPLLPGSDCPSI